MANSRDPDQTAPIGVVCSGSTLFACILNLSVILGNHLQQTTSTDNIFRCFFGALRVKVINIDIGSYELLTVYKFTYRIMLRLSQKLQRVA